MREGIERKILKKLYRSYRETQSVSRFPAADIFREFSIANGSDLSPIHKSNFIDIDERKNLYITDEGIKYMNKVFAQYEKLAGLVKNGGMENRDKESRAFAQVGKEIENGQATQPTVFNVKGSQLHFGSGDNIGRDKNKNPQPSLLSKYWWGLLIPIVVIVVGFIVTEGKKPELLNFLRGRGEMNEVESVATSTLNLSDILAEYNSKETSLEKQNFLKIYDNTIIQGSGSFVDIGKVRNGYLVTINVSHNEVSCIFGGDPEIEKRLLLLKKGQLINFSGTFTNAVVFRGGWSIQNCTLLK